MVSDCCGWVSSKEMEEKDSAVHYGLWRLAAGKWSTFSEKNFVGVPVVFWRNCLAIGPCLQDGISKEIKIRLELWQNKKSSPVWLPWDCNSQKTMWFRHCEHLGVWTMSTTLSQQTAVYRAKWLLAHTSVLAEGLNWSSAAFRSSWLTNQWEPHTSKQVICVN